MYILVSGVRHRTAPIEIRECFALPEEEVPAALQALKAQPDIEECAILTTCNRTELYVVTEDTALGLQAVKQFYATFKGVQIEQYREYTFNLLHDDAVSHLFRVAAGLDSLIMGEGQIMGQVKDALALGQKQNTTGPLLDKLFKSALTAGKRVRTETGLAEKDVSVSLAAYHFARQHVPDLAERRITLIGGGKMAEIMMSLLKQGMTPAQQAQVMLVNRSLDRLAELSQRYGFKGLGWDRLDEAIEHAEVLFVATGAPHVVLGKADFEGKGRKLVIDIAVPRNVDPRVAEFPDIQLFNTDNLGSAAGFSLEAQAALKQQARHILDEECESFHDWRMSLSVVPTITRLREKVERIRKAELANTTAPETAYQMMDQVSRNLIRKILHDPTVRLKNSRQEDITYQASVLRHLFNIENDATDACPADNDAIFA